MYEPDEQMTFIQAIQDAKRVYIKKNFAKTGSAKKVEVLDIMNSIASAKSSGMVGSGLYFTLINSREMDGRAGSLGRPFAEIIRFIFIGMVPFVCICKINFNNFSIFKVGLHCLMLSIL